MNEDCRKINLTKQQKEEFVGRALEWVVHTLTMTQYLEATFPSKDWAVATGAKTLYSTFTEDEALEACAEISLNPGDLLRISEATMFSLAAFAGVANGNTALPTGSR